MKNFIVYNESGEILRSGSCPDSMLQNQASMPGEFVIEGVADDEKQYIDIVGKLVIEKPAKPHDYAVFDFKRGAWTDVILPVEDIAASAIANRNMLLFRSDWTQLPDVPLATKEAWAIYRQDLRDITAQSGFPRDIIWPVQPA